MLGCFAEPFESFIQILAYTFAIIIAEPKIKLCIGVTSFSRFAIPSDCFLPILCYALAVEIAVSKSILSFVVTMFSCFAVPSL